MHDNKGWKGIASLQYRKVLAVLYISDDTRIIGKQVAAS
jgi:hypothetical protein